MAPPTLAAKWLGDQRWLRQTGRSCENFAAQHVRGAGRLELADDLEDWDVQRVGEDERFLRAVRTSVGVEGGRARLHSRCAVRGLYGRSAGCPAAGHRSARPAHHRADDTMNCEHNTVVADGASGDRTVTPSESAA